MKGVENSPFEGFWFEGEIEFGSVFPDNAPFLNFITPIFHPNLILNKKT